MSMREQLHRVARSLRTLGTTNEHFARVVMNRETKKLVAALHPEKLNTLEISGDSWRASLPFASYRSANYPELDICERPLDEKFNLIIAEQVFEHLLWPYRAAKNLLRML